MTDPIKVIADHPAPMAIRWGRGRGLGLFAVRTSTPIEIPGVDPRDLEAPPFALEGMTPAVRIHGRRLWIPVEAIGEGGAGRFPAPLEQALAHLSAPPGRARRGHEGGVIGLATPPFATPYGFELHNARAIQDAGEIPNAARDLVDPARQAASRSVAAHAATHLLHDGTHLYERMRIPLLNPSDLGRFSTSLMTVGAHRPAFLHTRLGRGGRLPFGKFGNECIPVMTGLADRLGQYLEGVDLGDEDVDRFLASAPPALVNLLRAMRLPQAEPILERLWPLLVSGARGDPPEVGIESAAETIRTAAAMVMEDGQAVLGAGNTFRYLHRMAALKAYVGFVEQVVRPSVAGPASAEDDDAIATLAP